MRPTALRGRHSCKPRADRVLHDCAWVLTVIVITEHRYVVIHFRSVPRTSVRFRCVGATDRMLLLVCSRNALKWVANERV